MKFTGAACLHDDGAFLRSDEVRDASGNDDEPTPRVVSSIRDVKFHALAQESGAFNDRHQFALCVGVRQDTRASGYFHSIDPRAQLYAPCRIPGAAVSLYPASAQNRPRYANPLRAILRQGGDCRLQRE